MKSCNTICGIVLIAFVITLASCRRSSDLSSNKVNAELNRKVHHSADPDTGDVFQLLKNQSRVNDKNLFLVFSFRACAFCRMFERYHHDSLVNSILSKYIIVADIDIDHTKGGKEIYTKYGKVGFPSWAIVDSTGKLIADSEDRKDNYINVGYPDKQVELEYYVNSLKKAAPSITNSECNILKDKLKYYRNK